MLWVDIVVSCPAGDEDTLVCMFEQLATAWTAGQALQRDAERPGWLRVGLVFDDADSLERFLASEEGEAIGQVLRGPSVSSSVSWRSLDGSDDGAQGAPASPAVSAWLH
jgi:hypothetical protein